VRSQDMAPMNVLQMYWLRYGGHAAFQTKDIVRVAEAPAGKSKLPPGPKLQSAEDSELFLQGTHSTGTPANVRTQLIRSRAQCSISLRTCCVTRCSWRFIR
jgi:hypothetical protein